MSLTQRGSPSALGGAKLGAPQGTPATLEAGGGLDLLGLHSTRSGNPWLLSRRQTPSPRGFARTRVVGKRTNDSPTECHQCIQPLRSRAAIDEPSADDEAFEAPVTTPNGMVYGWAVDESRAGVASGTVLTGPGSL